MEQRPPIVVVGYGMVAHRFLAECVERDLHRSHRLVVLAEEWRPAYDRVALSSYFDGASEDDLRLAPPGWCEANGIDLRLGEPAVRIDPERRLVATATGETSHYERLVLATGSRPFVPPVPGHDRPGCFVYRTLDDLDAIAAWAAQPHVRAGAVVGGGLLGLEAANALRHLGLETHVVELAPRLMPVQLDDGAAAMLRRHVEALGIAVHTGWATDHLAGAALGDGPGAALDTAAGDGATGTAPGGAMAPVAAVVPGDGAPLPVQVVVFSAGIRPADQLARDAGLALGERGGVAVDAHLESLTDPAIVAIGEVAAVGGRTYGLVAPGYDMARLAAARLAGADLSTKLKLLGVDVASFGDAFGHGAGSRSVVWADDAEGIYKRLVVDGDGRVAGGMLVGDASAYDQLRLMAAGDLPTPAELAPLVAPAAGVAPTFGADALADGTQVCSCNNVAAGAVRAAVAEGGRTVGEMKSLTRAGTGCGGCLPLVQRLLDAELTKAGETVDRSLCEHFAYTRQELFDLVRFHRHRTWGAVLGRHGQGRGCEICKPVVASILASLGNGYVLDGDGAAIQDTNDHVLANMQRDGTYSVVPRVPGGEITPDQLIALGRIAKEFGLYTKITGGQRIDLFGARLEQLPAIWQRVLAAGMESGHAYGKAVRTVKSCVGETWCRYGVQDSVSMAIRLELRYRGLRAPHKLKLAVSGCARECAEAQSKDIGVIATETGWNLYVCGNGGARPRHADLFATDLDDESLIRLIDRFVMFYVRTADRLERTATWFERLDGGIDHLRAVLVDDSLGVCAELEDDIDRHVATYECEWKATLADPDRLRRFVTFVNAPGEPDPDIVMVPERGQPRPARPGEREVAVSIAGGGA